MGCVKSKIDSDAAQRCKVREQLLDRAAVKRRELASAQSGYLSSLKNVGAAIRQFEIISSDSALPASNTDAVAAALASAPPMLALTNSYPAPPQPPGFDTSRKPLFRTWSTPMSMETAPSGGYQHQPLTEEPENEFSENDDMYRENHSIPELEDASQSRRQTPISTPRMTPRSVKGLSEILKEIDDFFLNSYSEGTSISKHYLHAKRTLANIPSPNEGNLDHHQQVSRLLSWSKSPQESDRRNGDDNLASILDRLHAWEIKLYDETKGMDVTVSTLKKKQRQLESKLERGGDHAGVEEAKRSVHFFEAKCLVEYESIEQTNIEIRKLRDEQLLPMLMEFLNALKVMWRTMYNYHQKQALFTKDLMMLKPDIDSSIKGECGKITNDLKTSVKSWRDHLEKMAESERGWMEAMAEWSRKQNGNDVLGSSQVIDRLIRLCEGWRNMLKDIPYEKVIDALDKFIYVLHDMVMRQNDESESMKKSENLQRNLERKKLALENLESKSRQERVISGEKIDSFSPHPLHEKKELVELLERQLQEERERHDKLQTENRAMMFECLRLGLPNVLDSIRDFSEKCMTGYEGLYDEMKEYKIK